MSVMFLSTRTIKLPTGEQTVRLPTIIHCYLLTHCLEDGPVAAVIMANVVANVASLMNGATALRMGKLAIGAKASIISKQFCRSKVTANCRLHRALTEARSHTRRDMVPTGSKQRPWQRRWQPSTPEEEDPKEAAEAESVCSNDEKLGPIRSNNYIWWRGERIMVMYQRRSYQDRRRKVRTTGFLAFAVHSKMSQSTNAKGKPMEGLYTDTDPDDRSEIITDVTIRMPGKAGTMMMEVKVDPGVQPSCIPLHKFKTLFPHLCRDGLPKEGLLDNTQNEFQSYNGGDMTCYGHLLIDVKDKVTKKYHPIRFYVMNTDVPRILISHAASYWLGLVRVLCDNKAPRIKRQVASIDKKIRFQSEKRSFQDQFTKYGKQLSEETDDTEDGHFRKGRHSKSKDAQFRGRQITRKKDSHWSEIWQRRGRQ